MCFLTAWHIYLTILIHWNIYSFIYLPIATWGGCGWNWTNRGWKKDNSRYFSFLKNICQMKNLPLRMFFLWTYVFYHIYTLANQCHWSALWQILCVHQNHRRSFEKKNCVLSCLFLPTCTRHQFPRGHVQRELLFCKRTLPKICHLRNQWH